MQIIKTLPFSTRHFLITLLSCSLSPFVGANEIDDLSFLTRTSPLFCPPPGSPSLKLKHPPQLRLLIAK